MYKSSVCGKNHQVVCDQYDKTKLYWWGWGSRFGALSMFLCYFSCDPDTKVKAKGLKKPRNVFIGGDRWCRSTTMSPLTFMVLSERSEELLDGLLWTLVQMCSVPRGWILMTAVIRWHFTLRRRQVKVLIYPPTSLTRDWHWRRLPDDVSHWAAHLIPSGVTTRSIYGFLTAVQLDGVWSHCFRLCFHANSMFILRGISSKSCCLWEQLHGSEIVTEII